MDAQAELERRLAALDAELNCGQPVADPCSDIRRFIEVLEQVTYSGRVTDFRALPRVSVETADDVQKRSRLLARLENAVPEIVSGPIHRDSQYWVAKGRPQGKLTSSRLQFIDVSNASAIETSTKPFGVGLFTATGVLGSYGMWRAYLDLNRGSTLFPLPWHTWALKPRGNAVVREIASAVEWVEFVLSYPKREQALLFPDWRLAADDYDAIHMTLRAILATQGLYFPTSQGIIAAPYWDVESTFWLHWCFDSARLVETVT